GRGEPRGAVVVLPLEAVAVAVEEAAERLRILGGEEAAGRRRALGRRRGGVAALAGFLAGILGMREGRRGGQRRHERQYGQKRTGAPHDGLPGRLSRSSRYGPHIRR